MTVSTKIHLLRPVFTVQDYTGLKVKSRFLPATNWKKSNRKYYVFIFKMAAMLHIPRAFPRVSCLGSAKAVERHCPGLKIGDKSKKIPRYSPVCPRMSTLPGWPLKGALLQYTILIFFFLVLN